MWACGFCSYHLVQIPIILMGRILRNSALAFLNVVYAHEPIRYTSKHVEFPVIVNSVE